MWSDGAEYTIGNKLQSYQINITEEIDTEYLKRNKSNKKVLLNANTIHRIAPHKFTKDGKPVYKVSDAD